MSRSKQVGLTAQVRKGNAHLRRRHGERRVTVVGEEEALARAWHSLQLHWLKAYPAYRAALAQRVSDAAKRAERLSQKIDKAHEGMEYR